MSRVSPLGTLGTHHLTRRPTGTYASSDNVTPIETATNTAGTPIAVGDAPLGIAITPNQTPTADLTASPLAVEVGEPVSFDASGSSDDEGVETYRFDYGDGDVSNTASSTRNHAYTAPGTYQATVTADDGDNCQPLDASRASPHPSPARPPTATAPLPTSRSRSRSR